MKDIDYAVMTAIELKQQCIKKGLDSKGKKSELIARLKGEDEVVVEEPVFLEDVPEEEAEVELLDEDGQVESLQDEIKKLQAELKEARAAQEIRDINIQEIEEEIDDERKAMFAPYLTSNRLTDLDRKISVVLAGKANFKIDTNKRIVEFEGGPKIKECTTLISPDAAIIATAKRYVARVFIGGNGKSSRI